MTIRRHKWRTHSAKPNNRLTFEILKYFYRLAQNTRVAVYSYQNYMISLYESIFQWDLVDCSVTENLHKDFAIAMSFVELTKIGKPLIIFMFDFFFESWHNVCWSVGLLGLQLIIYRPFPLLQSWKSHALMRTTRSSARSIQKISRYID